MPIEWTSIETMPIETSSIETRSIEWMRIEMLSIETSSIRSSEETSRCAWALVGVQRWWMDDVPGAAMGARRLKPRHRGNDHTKSAFATPSRTTRCLGPGIGARNKPLPTSRGSAEGAPNRIRAGMPSLRESR